MTAEVTTDVGALLGEMAFHQILAVPRWPDSTDAEAGVSGARAHVRRSKDSDVIRSGVLVALAGAHSELSAIAVAWLRRAPVGSVGVAPVEVYVGGRQSFGRPSQSLDGEVSVLFPAGSRGKPVENRHVVDHLAVLPNWSRCLGTYDSHVVAAEDSPSGQYRAPFEDYITSVPSKTFAWLVVAEPIPRDTLEQRLPALQERLYDLKGMEHDRFKVERAEAEYRNLLRARATGIWRVHVLVGTPTLGETRSLAALFCAGSDLARQPYMLLPDTTTGSFQDVARCTSTEGEDFASPFEGTTDLLATIARPPEQEIPGVRALNLPAFDLTPETPATGIHLGEALDANGEAAGAVYVTTGTLNRHAFVCGATGSGKSQTVRSILEELSVAGIPWLVIEPAKAEYARMAGRLAERAKPEYRPITGQVARSRSAVHLIRPGDTTVAPASLNPLEPEPGFPLQTHVDLVRALFLAAFEAEEPFPQVLAAALTRCYTDLGWDLALGRSRRRSIVPRFPTLEDLQRTAKLVVAGIGYGPEVTDNVRGFVDVRIGSLRLGTPGRFFEGGHPLDVGALLKLNVVLEIEDVGSDEDKAFLIGSVLIRVAEHLRVRSALSEGPIPLLHVTVVEEAHRLLKNARPGTPAAHAVELFAGLLAEIRAYGEGIIVAEQIPSKVLSDVVKNTALKVMHRLPAQDDRETVGATMNLDRGQSRYVVTLPPGTAAVFADGMDRPILTRMPLREAWETARLARRDVPLTRVRGPGCGGTCRGGAPCTLEQIVEAVKLADDADADGSRLAVWIELVVVAHLLGLASPRPAQAWLERVVAQPRRRVECAVGYAAQAAVDARYRSLVRTFAPESLVVHTRDYAMAVIDQLGPRCAPSDVEFQSGPYRWMDVRRELENAIEDGLAGAHPLTEDWRNLRGLSLPGDTPAAQLENLWSVREMRQSSDPVVFGAQSPSRLEELLRGLSNAADPKRLVHEALDHLDFGDNDWSSDFLSVRTEGGAR